MFGPGGLFGGGGHGGGFFGPQGPSRFDQQYQVYPVSFIGKDELEKGNKIILPASALDHLARLNISYPMLFEVSNPGVARKTHCGVQEFVAEEGMCNMPYWMMCNLLLQEGDLIRINNTTLPQGSFVKLQPVSSDFLDIHNHRAVLEHTLRHFATLTVGDCIVINYNQKKYEIEVIECRPAQAISIIEADVSVDFAPPKDYKEPAPDYGRPRAASSSASASAPMGDGFMKAGNEDSEMTPVEEPPDDGFKLFGGAGQRVKDGKAAKTPLGTPSMGPAASPFFDEDALTPWKKRIPGGVKYTKAPPSYMSENHMVSSADIAMARANRFGQDKLFAGSGNSLGM